MWLLDDIRNERWDQVRRFLEEMDSQGLSEIDKSILLTELCFHGKSDLVARMLEIGVEPNYRFGGEVESKFSYDLEFGTTPIGQTILGSKWKGNHTLKTLDVLLIAGADPNQITYSGYTPLQLAIAFDRPEFAGILLLRGANPELPSADLDKPTAFDIARNIEWARYMLARWSPEEGL